MSERLCPRCRKTPLAPNEGLCQSCQAELLAGGTRETLAIDLVPVLREALATTAPGEDFDEALLRALKRLHPEQGDALYPAFSRLLQVETERTGDTKQQVARRMADSAHPPTLSFTSNLGRPTVINETVVATSEGKTYHSRDEMPPELRRAVEGKLRGRREKPRVRVGCGMALVICVGAVAAALLRR